MVLNTEAEAQRCSVKGVLTNFGNFETRNFVKEGTLAQVFSCEFSEIRKNTFFIEHLWWLLL